MVMKVGVWFASIPLEVMVVLMVLVMGMPMFMRSFIMRVLMIVPF